MNLPRNLLLGIYQISMLFKSFLETCHPACLINFLFVYLNQLNLWLVSVSLECAASFWKLFLASSSSLAIESQRGEEEKRIRSAKWSRDGWQWWLFTTAMFNKNNSRTLVFRSPCHLSDLRTKTVNFRIQIKSRFVYQTQTLIWWGQDHEMNYATSFYFWISSYSI